MSPTPHNTFTVSFLALITALLVVASLRLLAILPSVPPRLRASRQRCNVARILVVLGSGGHTHEMFYLLRDLDVKKYTHRTYVISSGDDFSAQRAIEFEARLAQNAQSPPRLQRKGIERGKRRSHMEAARPSEHAQVQPPRCVGPAHYDIATVPRARNIHQPLWSTPISSLLCLWRCFTPLLSGQPSSSPNEETLAGKASVFNDLPDMIITNGPATAVIVIVASLILRFFNIRGASSRFKCRTVYVESFARVKTLSLSGKILLPIVDRFLVQWDDLEGKGGRAQYWGMLV